MFCNQTSWRHRTETSHLLYYLVEMSSRKISLSSWAEVRVKLQMWLTVCGETQSVVRNQADSSETGPGTEAMGQRTWQVKYAPQSDRRWVRSGLAGVRLRNILEMDRVRSSYDGGMRTGLLKVTVLRPAVCSDLWR